MLLTRYLEVVVTALLFSNIFITPTPLAGQVATAQYKKDTIVLSVYNTDKKYLLTQANFNPKVAKAGLLGEMVIAYDTAHIYNRSQKKRRCYTFFLIA